MSKFISANKVEAEIRECINRISNSSSSVFFVDIGSDPYCLHCGEILLDREFAYIDEPHIPSRQSIHNHCLSKIFKIVYGFYEKIEEIEEAIKEFNASHSKALQICKLVSDLKLANLPEVHTAKYSLTRELDLA